MLAALLSLGMALAAEPLDLNDSTAEALAELDGVGPHRAALIVAWRTEHGDFHAIDEVATIPGIGIATFRAIRPALTVQAAGTVPPPSPRSRVPINSASAEELAALPGVDPKLAAAIVADRERQGPFETCRDLGRIEGIGVATLAVLSPQCRAD